MPLSIRIISAISGFTLALVSWLLACQPVSPLPIYFAVPAILAGMFVSVVAFIKQ